MIKLNKFSVCFHVFCGLFSLGSVLLAQEMTGYTIMEKALEQSNWKDMQADLKLILTNARGEQRVREIAFYSSDTEDDLTRMLMRFQAPADVKGTGYLSLETAGGDEENYLYLPALRRVKKIASSGGGGNFMSSDFTYYDIGMPELEDWTYTLLGDEQKQGKACYVIECQPATDKILADTGYGKIVRWVDKERFNTLWSEYYDIGLTKWKELEVVEFLLLKGTDFASDMIMRDLQTGHSSEMRFENLQVDVELADDFFSVRYLQRGR